ncbi:hypothetical protein [Nonomuraea endophytica]|uniref:hypothetical protein n=1 Tax=Nonomuraea endophytica TaxID=714136 RepID=UPI0037C65937
MTQPALVPAVPTPGLWVEMKLVWRRKHIAFYQGPHAVEPLMADDLGTLRAAEVLIEWVLSEDVWPEPVNLNDLPVRGAVRLAAGEPAVVGGHDHDDRHLRSRHLGLARPGDGDGDGPREVAGAMGRGRGRFIPRQRTEAA